MGLLDLLFPRECAGCRKPGEYLCTACKKTLFAHPEICPFCHKPSTDFQTCFACKGQEDALTGILIGFSYQTLIKKLILKVKFGHKKDVVPFLAGRIALLVQTHGKLSELSKDDQIFISFIPSHRRRKYLEKGYNQSELLAKELAKQLDLPILPLVKKMKYTVSQLKLKREERKKNLENVFVPFQLDKLSHGATVLFVDDVTTTGSTLLHIAKVIKQERDDLNIWGAVVARNMQ
ncbi:MAG: double zinc ribbon domain-containing protein [Candidatus Peribacteria bacterium]|jgi:ComF family protein|nr:double zinc ribbon domain-containing protein [Candidatus Peribacteria bacterium]